jgi:hypothetical protein
VLAVKPGKVDGVEARLAGPGRLVSSQKARDSAGCEAK